MGTPIQDRYVLDGGSPEVTRLRVQSETLEPYAESLLDEIGVSPGSMALDLACGPHGLLRPLAQRVGPAGRVIGLDLDQAEVSAAEDYVRRLGLSNVEVLQGDAFHTQFDSDSFDVVHARFLIAPVGHADELVTEMMRVAKPGGIIILEEPDSSPWSCVPQSSSFERLKGVILESFRLGGGNLDAGPGLYGLMRRSGLTRVHTRGVALTLHDGHPYMRSTIQFATSLRRRILENGLMTDSELDQTIAEVDRVVSQPDSWMISFLVIQAWARKPLDSGRTP